MPTFTCRYLMKYLFSVCGILVFIIHPNSISGWLGEPCTNPHLTCSVALSSLPVIFSDYSPCAGRHGCARCVSCVVCRFVRSLADLGTTGTAGCAICAPACLSCGPLGLWFLPDYVGGGAACVNSNRRGLPLRWRERHRLRPGKRWLVVHTYTHTHC